MSRVSISIALLLLWAPTLWAREYSTQVRVESAEELYDMADAGELTDAELETLVAYIERPIDLNRADRYILWDLPELTWAQVDAIIAYRNTLQGFTLVEELRQVPGINEDVYQSIKPFVYVRTAEDPGKEMDYVRGKAESAVLFYNSLGEDLRVLNYPYRMPAGYLASEITSFDFGAGVEVVMRPLVTPAWDRSSGMLVATESPICSGNERAPCTDETFRLQGIYGSWESGIWRVIAGTYNVGFGQRLTIDTTGREFPRGWESRLFRTKDRDDGTVRPQRNLRGGAIAVDGLDTPIGWLDATVFASHQEYDLYRNDFWIGGDDSYGELMCVSPSDCPDGYTCRVNGRCYSSAVLEYDPATGTAGNRRFAFPTVQNAYRELLAGANVTFNFDERTSVGVTGYGADVRMNFPPEANARFSMSAAYPVRPVFGAASLDAKWGWGPIDVMGEVGTTERGAMAAVARAIYTPVEWLELDGRFRWYSRDYDNPKGRSDASAELTLGNRRRNELGGLLNVVVRPISKLKFVTRADFWVRSYEEYYLDGKRHWLEHPTMNLRLRQRASWGFTSHEDASIQFDYGNNDLLENGRTRECNDRLALPGILPGVKSQDCGFYESLGLDDTGAGGEVNPFVRLAGRGEKYRLQVGLSSTRLFGINMGLRYVNAWVDVRSLDDRMAHEHYIRFSASRNLWQGARLWGAAKYWFARASDNSEVDLTTYAGFSQRLFDNLLQLQVVYGVLAVERRAGLDLLHFGEFRLASAF